MRALLLALLGLALSCGGEATDDGPSPRQVSLDSWVGDMALDFLRSDSFDSLLVEMDCVPGLEPSQTTQDALLEELTGLLDKPGGIALTLEPSVEPLGDGPLVLEDIMALEEAQRDHYYEGNQGVIYFLFVDGHYYDDTDTLKTLGLSYRGSSMVIFSQTIVDSTTVQGGDMLQRRAEILRELTMIGVVIHEMGHMLGLVNITVPMGTDHEDPYHPNHCADPTCIMYWANNGSSMITILKSYILDGYEEMETFDADCLADLDAQR